MPSALSKAVERIARRAVGKDWNLYAALLEHWQEIVGAEYARVAAPVKITFPHQPNAARRENGTLCLRLPKGLAMEMSFKSEQIRQRINGYFGYEAIGRIALDPVYETPTAVEAPPIQTDAEAVALIHQAARGIEDEALRHALEGFGEAMLARRGGVKAGSF